MLVTDQQTYPRRGRVQECLPKAASADEASAALDGEALDVREAARIVTLHELGNTVDVEYTGMYDDVAPGATVEQVAYRFYELAVQRTQSGHYYQDTSGRWVRK